MSVSRLRQAARCAARGVPLSMLVAVITATCVTLALFGLTFAALPSDPSVYRERVQDAFRDGTLPGSQTDPYTVFQSHLNNECVSLSSVVVPYPSRLDGALSARITTPIVPPCQSLRVYVLEPGSDDITVGRYDRYLHGWRVLWFMALPVFSVFQVFQLTFLTGLAAMLALVAVGAQRTVGAFAQPSPSAHGNNCGTDLWLAKVESSSVVLIGLCFVLFFGWFSFGFRPTHAVWGIVVLVFLLVTSAARLRDWSVARLACFCSGFGALLACVDFLVGAPALGLSVVVGMLALRQMDLETPAYVARIISGAIAFTCGFVFPFFIKLALVSLFIDPSAAVQFFDQLIFRMAGNETAPGHGLPADLLGRAREAGFDLSNEPILSLKMMAFMGAKLVHGLTYSVGSHAAAAIILGTTVVAGCIGGVRTLCFSSHRQVSRLVVALLLSVLVIVAWYLIFRQHTIVHTRFMSRLLVWPVAVGYVVGLIGVLDWMRRRLTITKPKLS